MDLGEAKYAIALAAACHVLLTDDVLKAAWTDPSGWCTKWPLTATVIITMLIVYFRSKERGHDNMMRRFGLVADSIMETPRIAWPTLFTCVWIHADVIHLVWNVIAAMHILPDFERWTQDLRPVTAPPWVQFLEICFVVNMICVVFAMASENLKYRTMCGMTSILFALDAIKGTTVPILCVKVLMMVVIVPKMETFGYVVGVAVGLLRRDLIWNDWPVHGVVLGAGVLIARGKLSLW